MAQCTLQIEILARSRSAKAMHAAPFEAQFITGSTDCSFEPIFPRLFAPETEIDKPAGQVQFVQDVLLQHPNAAHAPAFALQFDLLLSPENLVGPQLQGLIDPRATG